MNINLIETDNGKRTIDLLAEIVLYGIEWNRDLGNDVPGIIHYKVGGLETTSFIFSCCVVQWFGASSCSVSDVVEMLKLESLVNDKKVPTLTMLKKKITKFLLEYEPQM